MLTMPKGGFREGSGKKAKNPDAPLTKNTIVGAALGAELLARLDAVLNGRGRSEYIRNAVQKAVETDEAALRIAAAEWTERQESGEGG